MKKITRLIASVFLLLNLPALSFASPWFTGPLLASAGHTVAPGDVNIEPYFMYTDDFGLYGPHWRVIKVPKTHTFRVSPSMTFGFNNYIDISAVIPQDNHYKEGQSAHSMGETSFGIGFQALEDKPDSWQPDLRIVISETLPSAKYRNLDPAKLGVDAFGNGTYRTDLSFNFQKLMKPLAEHYMRGRLSLHYTNSSKAHLISFNAFGGGFNTLGDIKPGAQFTATTSLEFQLTQHWVPVFEFQYLQQKGTHFSGNKGTTANGETAAIGHGNIEQLSLSPAMEYNFNANWGVIAGTWFSIRGQDTNEFITGMLAINYYS